MVKKVLLTGGAGFIGSHLTRYLLKKRRDWQIVVLDSLTYAGKRENLKDMEGHPSFTFVKGDASDEDLVDSLFQEYHFSILLHLAAETHVDRSIQYPLLVIKNNILSTGVLLEVFRRYGGDRFLLVSTDEVYGSLDFSAPPSTPQSPLSPTNPYSASKGAGDLLALSYWKTFQLPVIITRCTNNYGPYQNPEKFIPLMITRVLKGEKIPIYGTGENKRDWIHVEDHSKALDLILEKGHLGRIYHIGAGQEKSNRDLVEEVLEIMGAQKGFMEFVEDRPSHDLRYALDISPLKELGFSPSIPIKTGLKKVVKWYQEHPSWWQEG